MKLERDFPCSFYSTALFHHDPFKGFYLLYIDASEWCCLLRKLCKTCLFRLFNLISCMAISKGITNRSDCIVVHIICTSRESGMNPTENLGADFLIIMARAEKQGAASMAGTWHFSRETRHISCLHQRMPSESTGKGLVLIFA